MVNPFEIPDIAYEGMEFISDEKLIYYIEIACIHEIELINNMQLAALRAYIDRLQEKHPQKNPCDIFTNLTSERWYLVYKIWEFYNQYMREDVDYEGKENFLKKHGLQ